MHIKVHIKLKMRFVSMKIVVWTFVVCANKFSSFVDESSPKMVAAIRNGICNEELFNSVSCMKRLNHLFRRSTGLVYCISFLMHSIVLLLKYLSIHSFTIIWSNLIHGLDIPKLKLKSFDFYFKGLSAFYSFKLLGFQKCC